MIVCFRLRYSSSVIVFDIVRVFRVTGGGVLGN